MSRLLFHDYWLLSLTSYFDLFLQTIGPIDSLDLTEEYVRNASETEEGDVVKNDINTLNEDSNRAITDKNRKKYRIEFTDASATFAKDNEERKSGSADAKSSQNANGAGSEKGNEVRNTENDEKEASKETSCDAESKVGSKCDSHQASEPDKEGEEKTKGVAKEVVWSFECVGHFLRRDIEEENDYLLLPLDAWTLLSSWFAFAFIFSSPRNLSIKCKIRRISVVGSKRGGLSSHSIP
jgi:hypothetical protein